MCDQCDPYGRDYDLDKDETAPCLAGTVGCCINHALDDGPCESY